MCAITTLQKLVCWGCDCWANSPPSEVMAASVSYIAAGSDTSCAILADNHQIACWGINTNGIVVNIPTDDNFEFII